MKPESNHELIGQFDLRTAGRICERLEQQGIAFQLEVDDSPIRNMSPFQAAYGGTYGSGATANIYVAPEVYEQSIEIVNAAL